jgi:3'-phosphoadenosine 5'-phosphosulfate (PAPS) 3'-phosphatase
MKTYGEMPGAVIGALMKELVNRAIQVIHKNRMLFDVTEKSVDYKKDTDIYTTADTEAQRVYLHSLREWFPTFGIIAEEDELSIPCTHPLLNAYFTVDPLDGTKAFSRRQSEGFGTMLSLVINKEVVASVVADVMTEEMYYYRPDSEKVHRLRKLGDFPQTEYLHTIDRSPPLSNQYVLLRENPLDYSESVQAIVAGHSRKGLFKNITVSGGSIGTWMARLWKGEVGAVVLPAQKTTPWDFNPILGITEKLGFAHLAIKDKHLFRLSFKPIENKTDFANEMIIVHESKVKEIWEWVEEQHFI